MNENCGYVARQAVHGRGQNSVATTEYWKCEHVRFQESVVTRLTRLSACLRAPIVANHDQGCTLDMPTVARREYTAVKEANIHTLPQPRP